MSEPGDGKIEKEICIIMLVSLFGASLLGPIFLIIGCDPKNYPDNCLLYDTFDGYIYDVLIQSNPCSNILNTTICYTGYVYASTILGNEQSIDNCKTKMIVRSTSYEDVNTKMSGYKYGQEVYWIKDGTNECHYPDAETARFKIGIVLSVIFSWMFFPLLWYFYKCVIYKLRITNDN